MKNTKKQPDKGVRTSPHYSYILRLWREDLSQPTSWRASLEDPHQGERIGFASLEQMFVYLMELIEINGDSQHKKEK